MSRQDDADPGHREFGDTTGRAECMEHAVSLDRTDLDPELLALLSQPAPRVAAQFLGAMLSTTTAEGTVTLRITELEAYGGPADSRLPDPGAHTYRGRTARNASMFGPPGRIYVYFTYGMHHAVNLVCHPPDTAGGLLIRAGEVVTGTELARARRSVRRRSHIPEAGLARGPGNVAQSLGLTLEDDGAPIHSQLPVPPAPSAGTAVTLRRGETPGAVLQTARTGVSGPGGSQEFPWRFAVAGEASVSAYRAAAQRRRRS